MSKRVTGHLTGRHITPSGVRTQASGLRRLFKPQTRLQPDG